MIGDRNITVATLEAEPGVRGRTKSEQSNTIWPAELEREGLTQHYRSLWGMHHQKALPFDREREREIECLTALLLLFYLTKTIYFLGGGRRDGGSEEQFWGQLWPPFERGRHDFGKHSRKSRGFPLGWGRGVGEDRTRTEYGRGRDLLGFFFMEGLNVDWKDR